MFSFKVLNKMKGVVFLLLFCSADLFCQAVKPDPFYLVDTSRFYQLTSEERLLLKEELGKARLAKNDTLKFQIIFEMFSQMNDNDVWILYLKWVEKELEEKRTDQLYPVYYKKIKAGLLNNLGYYYSQKGDIAKALNSYSESLKIKEKTGNKAQVANTLSNIGLIYYNQGETEKALENYSRALNYYEALGHKEGIAFMLHNIASVYHDEDRLDSALILYRKSLVLNTELKDTIAMARNLDHISVVYRLKNDLPQALRLGLEALSMREKMNDLPGLASSLNRIAAIYADQNNLTKAITFSNRSLEIGKQIGFPEKIRDAADYLYNFYKDKKNPEKALEMHELYIQMRDSISNKEFRTASIRKQIQYDYDKKTELDSLKSAEHLVQQRIKHDEEIKQQRLYTYGGGIVALLMLSVAGVSFREYRNKRKANEIITRQKSEVEKQRDVIEEQKKKVEEHQKEIIDSITYAKRIQTALITNEKYIEKHINRLSEKK